MARRITTRLLVFSALLITLLVIIIHSSAYGLTRAAQVEALRRKFGLDRGDSSRTAPPQNGAAPLIPQADSSLEPSSSTTQPPPTPQQSGPASSQALEDNSASRIYTRALVIARTTKEFDMSTWLSNSFADDPTLAILPYTVDDPFSRYPIPFNKGREPMVYLTYIIDHYNATLLPDVSIFMHAHRWTWHNNDLLDSDSVQIIRRLSSPKVLRDGYFNLRCHQDPGCPAHLHPSTTVRDPSKPEEMEIGAAWAALFPGEPIPEVLSQPCCSQFALSRDRILSIPLATYVRLRQWLLDTKLHDLIAGRVFEYVWQKIWTGMDEWCPSEWICYCDGYGVCFKEESSYDDWMVLRKEFRKLALELQDYEKKDKEQPGKGWLDSKRVEEIRKRLVPLRADMEASRKVAFLHGNDAQNRATIAGRPWKKGDGY